MTKISEIATIATEVLMTDILEKETAAGDSEQFTAQLLYNLIIANLPTTTIKISLTADQINSAFTVPIACGISVPSGKYIQVIGASGNYNAGDASQTFSSININTISKPDYQAIFQMKSGAVSKWGAFVIDQTGDSYVEDQDLQISADQDSISGTGMIDIYITYITIQK